MIKVDPDPATPMATFSRPQYAKKPNIPSAPKITPPCSECGKMFWSWKVLFGHMRCHRERQWCRIKPPTQFCQPILTKDDHEVASCLLLLVNGSDSLVQVQKSNSPVTSFTGFSCNKALVAHKNIKKHFAATSSISDCEMEDYSSGGSGGNMVVQRDNAVVVLGHKCSICCRMFSSGQALGWHKRCHWEKGDCKSLSQGLDLNLPAPAPVQESQLASVALLVLCWI